MFKPYTIAAIVAAHLMLPVAAYSQTVVAPVISAVPVVEQVSVVRQRCVVETVTPTEQGAGGALLGAIVGGVVGNQIGKGAGRDIATGVGVIAGAAAGNEMQNGTRTQNRCTPFNETQNIIRGYMVTYEFAGQRYTQQMGYNPGATVTVSFTAR